MKHYFILLLLTCSCFYAAQATPPPPPTAAYQIQIGTFADPQYKRFKTLRSIGYVFALPQPNGLSKIRMGTYDSHKTASRKLLQVKAKGFKGAYLVKVPLEEADAVYIIQLATYDQTDDIYWADWQRITPNLCAQLSSSKIRVASGPFYTKEEANVVMERLQYKGPKDIFIKKVSEKVVHTVTDFEMNQSGLFENQKGIKRHSVQALQKLLTEQKTYFGKPDGFLGKNTRSAIGQYQSSNQKYQQYLMLAENESFSIDVEEYTLQYYINMISEDPRRANDGLQEFTHPIAKVFRAYMHLNGDIPVANRTTVVNRLMHMAIDQVFKRYQGKTRFDFSMKYTYEDLDQWMLHARSILEAVKDEPAVPCWLFERHPQTAAKAFAPYWNNDRDNYIMSSDCGTFFELTEMKILMTIAKDFASDKKQGEAKLAHLNLLYVSPTALNREEMRTLESWNGHLWQSLREWSKSSALQQKLYSTLRFAYYHALIKLEDNFIQKGFSGLDARSLSLKVLKYSVGCALDEYCNK
ncbi:MAG: peptidoglycan-binding protein [Aureispira sp.]|nr:peptidoglycan-binding protein [Aureispira sp.]